MNTKTTAQKSTKKTGLRSVLRTATENRSLKNKAVVKVASKSDLIRSFLKRSPGLTATKIKEKLEAKGLGVYPSEIYRVMSA